MRNNIIHIDKRHVTLLSTNLVTGTHFANLTA